MSLLIQMRQRIKAKKSALRQYKNALTVLFIKLRTAAPKWRNQLLFPTELHEHRELIILIGSQKQGKNNAPRTVGTSTHNKYRQKGS